MNKVTLEKYQAMNGTVGEVLANVDEINTRYNELMPKLAVIDRIDKKVAGLEKMAYAIDAYSKRLGKFVCTHFFLLSSIHSCLLHHPRLFHHH